MQGVLPWLLYCCCTSGLTQPAEFHHPRHWRAVQIRNRYFCLQKHERGTQDVAYTGRCCLTSLHLPNGEARCADGDGFDYPTRLELAENLRHKWRWFRYPLSCLWKPLCSGELARCAPRWGMNWEGREGDCAATELLLWGTRVAGSRRHWQRDSPRVPSASDEVL